MSKEERVKELKRLFTTPENQLRPSEFKTWYDLHKRIDELVGRPTFTHEFAFPDLLYEEILSGNKGNPFGESLIKATKLTKDNLDILEILLILLIALAFFLIGLGIAYLIRDLTQNCLKSYVALTFHPFLGK